MKVGGKSVTTLPPWPRTDVIGDLKGPLQAKNYFLSICSSKHIVPNPVDIYTHSHWECHKNCFCLALHISIKPVGYMTYVSVIEGC